MAISKIRLNGVTQIDLTQDTVTASHLHTGYTATGADGLPVVGEAETGGIVIVDTIDAAGGTIRSVTAANSLSVTSKTITTNGTYDSTDEGYDGYSEIVVNVEVSEMNYYTGSSAPSSSLGSNGDIYIQTGGS